MNPRPNFFLVGCPRCGTTWTNAALVEHPQVFVPTQKQVHFFDEKYRNGLDWYLEHFREAAPRHRAIGEVSTDYSLPHAIARLHEHFPEARLLYAVRNPVDRAFSFYQSRAPHEPWTSFEDAIEKEAEILERGRYIEEIERILELFPRERLKILFYDDLQADDRSYLRSIFEYLDVDVDFESSLYGNPLRAAMFPNLRRRLRQFGLTPLVNLVNHSPLGDLIRRQVRRSRKKPRSTPIAPETRAFLVDYYSTLNQRLADFTGRDLSRWSR